MEMMFSKQGTNLQSSEASVPVKGKKKKRVRRKKGNGRKTYQSGAAVPEKGKGKKRAQISRTLNVEEGVEKPKIKKAKGTG